MNRIVFLTIAAMTIAFAGVAQPCDDCPYIKQDDKTLAAPVDANNNDADHQRQTTGDDEERMLQAPPVPVWPNPTSGTVNFVPGPKHEKVYTWMILDQLGRPVVTGNTFGNTTEQIDLSLMQKGMYLLAIQDQDEQRIQKILVQ